MTNKVKIVSVVFCVVVVIGCCFGYSASVSQMYYDICSPGSCSFISSYEAEALWTIPADEAYEYGVYYSEGDVDAVEITYELYNPLNDSITIAGNLCYYYGEGDEWITAFDSIASTGDISEYENCKILPPGESMIFKEYVLVPEGAEEIYACPYYGSTDEMTIKL